MISLFLQTAEAATKYFPLTDIEEFSNVIVDEARLPSDLPGLLNFAFYVLLAVAVVLAIFGVIRGGYVYLTSADTGSGKSSAKRILQASVGGLLLALGGWLILNTINPQILVFDPYFDQLEKPEVVEIMAPFGVMVVATVDSKGNYIYTNIPKTVAEAWGYAGSNSMVGQTINGRQTYYAPGETVSDSYTDKDLGSFGTLIVGTPTVVGSAASVYYPAGTLIESNGITYIIDDNNLKKSGGGFVPANQNLTNNYTIDIFTRDVNKANTTDTSNSIKILYVPETKITSGNQIKEIRNNPNQYINR